MDNLDLEDDKIFIIINDMLTSGIDRNEFIKAYSAMIKAIFSILYSEFYDLDKLSDEIISKLQYQENNITNRIICKETLKRAAELKIKNKEKLIERLDYVNNEIQRLTSEWGI